MNGGLANTWRLFHVVQVRAPLQTEHEVLSFEEAMWANFFTFKIILFFLFLFLRG